MADWVGDEDPTDVDDFDYEADFDPEDAAHDTEEEIVFDIYNHNYPYFLERFRNAVTEDDVFGIPVLAPQGGPVRFLNVRVLNETTEVTLRFNRSNIYLLGYRRAGEEIYWEFTGGSARVIQGSIDALFTAKYKGAGSLQWDGLWRRTLLTQARLNDSIHNLANLGDPREERNKAICKKSVLTFIQFIPEAARFRRIRRLLVSNWVSQVPAPFTEMMIKMEKNWGQVSEALFQVNEEGDQLNLTGVRLNAFMPTPLRARQELMIVLHYTP